VTAREAYAALGLDASATTPDQARSRFRELVRAHHPDGKPSHEQAGANEATRTLIEACTLLRTQGFPRITSYANAGALRYECQAVAEPASADPLAWLDDAMRESIRTYLVGVMTLTFGVQFMFGAWTMGRRAARRDGRD
jgi:hypothetical protein